VHAGPRAGGEHEPGRAEHRVVAVGEQRRAGVVGPAVQVEAPAAVRADGRADADGLAEVDEPAALLDVELEVAPHPAERLRVGSERRRVPPAGRERVGQRDAVVVAQRQRPLGREGAGEQPRPRAGDAEAPALLVGERRDGERPGRPHAARAEQVDGDEPRHDPEGPVEGPAPCDGVEVAAGHDASAGVRVAPPGPAVAGAVLGDVEPPAGGLGGEPLPQRRLRRGVREAPVPAGRLVAADVGDGVEEPSDGSGGRHAPPGTSSDGTRTPRSRATSTARS
jgi:hypothetical protein